jgi:riboflavin kinase/FMN adenylyltransferase
VAGEEERVSSTRIRHALVQGDLGTANALLGRPHEVRGVVAQGDKRGRELGFPTANVSVPGDILLPADGIYAGWFERADGSVHPTAISLGRRPTFYVEAHASLLEAHLLDFDGDLYDEHVKVRFVGWLRGEARFDSVDELVAQIDRDCHAARRLLSSN